MISLLLPTPEELRMLLSGGKRFRVYEIAEDALPPRIILDQGRYFPTDTALTYRWAVPQLILLTAKQRIVGSIGGKGLLPDEDEVEIGYNVALTYRQLGIMTQAMRLLMADARQDKLRLVAHIEPDNHPSRALLVKCGFSHDATVAWPIGFALERWRWSPD